MGCRVKPGNDDLWRALARQAAVVSQAHTCGKGRAASAAFGRPGRGKSGVSRRSFSG